MKLRSSVGILLCWMVRDAQAFLGRSHHYHRRQSSTRQHAAISSQDPSFHHALAILTMTYNTFDRICNEAILETILTRTDKLSIVLRCEGQPPSVASLRRYVGTIYSQLWDCTVLDTQNPNLPKVVVYPAHLPNSAPESWITIQPDLDCICSRDEYLGWKSQAAAGEGLAYQHTDGQGGLQAHVRSVNAERKGRGLKPVQACGVSSKRQVVSNEDVVFLEDEELEKATGNGNKNTAELTMSFFGGSVDTPKLFESVAVGGTFDGMHYGHCKLLTLAVSSVEPRSGRLLVGVTQDAMLAKKEYAEFIPKYADRVQGVYEFLARLAPGMMNRVQIVPIEDNFGPPGHAETYFDALVLSHETLETGIALNRHRVKHLGLHPLKLLCTERTEAHGMSSTQLRRLRARAAGQLLTE
jgi:phosphopantetheine adenylyltransferase